MVESISASTAIKVQLEDGSLAAAPLQFVDGSHGVQMGPALSRILFYQVVSSEDSRTELRRISMALSLPTSALVELCVNTLSAVVQNSDALKNANEAQMNTIRNSINTLREIK